MLNFDMWGALPGYSLPAIEEVVAQSGVSWGHLNQLRYLPGALVSSSTDSGNTGYTDVLRPNLLMGRISATKKYAPWSPSATDGSQVIAGILLNAQKMQFQGVAKDRLVGYLLVGGPIRAKALQIASLTTSGIVGATSEWLVRRQMNQNFQFDDIPEGVGGSLMTLAATATITEAQTGTHFIVAGAAAVTATLPATAKLGLEYTFTNTTDQNLIVAAGTADTMIVYNDAAADSVALSTASEKIGGTIKVVGTGTAWMVIPHLWEGQTPTIVT